MKRRMKWFLGILLCACLFCSVARAELERSPLQASTLSRVVDIDDVVFHQRMLQRIAHLNGNTRVAGSPGYEQSARYVLSCLKTAGYRVAIQKFKFPYYQELSHSLLQRTSPSAKPYPSNTPGGFYTMYYSGSGDAEGMVVPVDLVMPPGETPNTSSSGCQMSDFAGFPAGAIALIQRGSCSYYEKAKNAQRAGASGVVIYNEGQLGRTSASGVTLTHPGITIPVVFTSYAIGKDLYQLGQKQEVRVHIKVDSRIESRWTENILAATRTGNPSQKVIVGAHLDSVAAGPGINDNGSGVAAVLETAVKTATWDIRPKNRIVFAFWAAEEEGLWGSTHYVKRLSSKQVGDISLYLNFDMLASPNWIRFVGDGDGSDTGVAGPPGSGFIEQVFVDYYARKKLTTEPHILGGRSDYAPFMDAGVPVGELLAGWDEIKTKEQAAVYGGTAGIPCDPNYHSARDTLKSSDLLIEKEMLKTIGYTVGYFAGKSLPVQKTEALRAVRSYTFEYLGPMAVR